VRCSGLWSGGDKLLGYWRAGAVASQLTIDPEKVSNARLGRESTVWSVDGLDASFPHLGHVLVPANTHVSAVLRAFGGLAREQHPQRVS